MQPKQISNSVPGSMGILLPCCRLCEKVPPRGMADGHFFGRVFICRTCEQEITGLEIGTAQYEYYIQKVKKLWE